MVPSVVLSFIISPFRAFTFPQAEHEEIHCFFAASPASVSQFLHLSWGGCFAATADVWCHAAAAAGSSAVIAVIGLDACNGLTNFSWQNISY